MNSCPPKRRILESDLLEELSSFRTDSLSSYYKVQSNFIKTK